MRRGNAHPRRIRTALVRPAAPWCSGIEALEPRQLLAGTNANFSGSSDADSWILRLDADGTTRLLQNTTTLATADYIPFTWPAGTLGTLSILAGGGNDQLIIDCTNGNPLPVGGMLFDGGVGDDWIVISNPAVSDGIDVGAGRVELSGLGLNHSGAENIDLQETDGDDLMLESVTVHSGGRLNVTPATRALRLQGLQVDLGGTLDLNDALLVVTHHDADEGDARTNALRALVRTAAGPQRDWRGTGLTSGAVRNDPRGSLTTLAVVNNDNGHGGRVVASVDGLGLPSNAILARASFFGDANLDGKVDGDDYFRIDRGLMRGSSDWGEGDATGDGRVNADDYAAADRSFVKQRPRVAAIAPFLGVGSLRHVEPFDQPLAWSAANVSLSADPDHVKGPGSPRQGLKMTWTVAGGQADLIRRLSQPVDLTNCHAILRYYVPPSSRGQLKEITFFVGNNGTSNAYASWNVQPPAVGWNEIQLAPDPTSLVGGKWIGKPDLARMNTLRVMVQAVAGAKPTITLGAMEWYRRVEDATTMHFIDDGYSSTWDEASYWSSKGLSVQIAIIPTRVGKPGYLTLAQLKDLQRMGHLIVNHTWDHPLDWNLMSLSQKAREIDLAADWMVANGFGEGSRIVVIPRTSADHEVDAKLVGRQASVLRDSGGPPNILIQQPLITLTQSHPDKYAQWLKAQEGIGGVDVTATHGVTPANLDQWPQLTAYIDFVAAEQAAGRVTMITVADLLKLSSGPDAFKKKGTSPG